MTHQTNETVTKLLKTYFWGELSREQQQDVIGWLISEIHNDQKEQALREIWDSYDRVPNKKTLEALEKVQGQLGFPEDHKQHTIRRHRRLWMRVAAICLPLLAAGGLTWQTLREGANPPAVAQTLMEVTVPDHQFQRITLPDGSDVWVNSGSNVSYSESEQKERVATLEGEAYFAVAKGKGTSFVVETQHLAVRVLGTQFNVRAYAAENQTTVTLDEGLVEVIIRDSVVHISPGDLLIYDHVTHHIQKLQNQPSTAGETEEEPADWRAGMLTFDYATLDEILAGIEAYYQVQINVEIPYDETELYSVTFTGRESIDQVMQVLQKMTGQFTYDRTHDQIVIH